MAARAMTAVRTPRALSAAVVLAVLVAALLGAWFYAGWHDVRARQQDISHATRRAADDRANVLARELQAQLEALIVREVRRPYFHYQNLMHDPNASPGLNVSPSPLARGAEDALVLGYFQLDANGRVSTPTINDDVPSLSEPQQRAAHQAFRARVKEDLSPPLVAALRVPARAANTRRATRPRSTPPSAPSSPPTSPASSLASSLASAVPATQPGSPASPAAQRPIVDALPMEPSSVRSESQQRQVIQVDPTVYSQNANPNQVYVQQALAPTAQLAATTAALPPPMTQSQTPTAQLPAPTTQSQAPADQLPAHVPALPSAPVTITISPLEWRTLPFDGTPSLVAVRQVETPDGTFAQGFVVNPSTLADWVASRTNDMAADLRPADVAGAEVVPGWRLTVSPRPQRLAQADVEADAIARTFLVQFFAIGTLAVGAAAFVVVLVRRAESLARERSRFAAAAAHELRTPLAGLRLYGDLLADGLGDQEKVRDYARRMGEEAARLGRVVSNVLAFSQLERDHLRIEAQAGPLSDALREVANRVQPTLDRSGATLDFDVPSELRASFDRDALARIIGNLIDNAEKYARHAADRTIRLSARAHGAIVEVAVEDRGHGVGDATRLFKPFSRGTSGNDNPAGLGLGLALSLAQAQAMGGELLYEPRKGGGARFVLRLPAA
jgi:signal transduction histidine kinase